MLRSPTLLTVAVLTLMSASANGSVQLRLLGGWPIPTSEFKSKNMALHLDEADRKYEFKTAAKYTLTGVVSIGLGRIPFELVLSSGIVYFDDQDWEVQETSYEQPLGTGRFSDFQHRLIPATLGLEYFVDYAEQAATTVGVGLGLYRYRFINRGELQLEYPNSDAQTFFGWHLSVTQHVRICERLGLCLDVDYHSMTLGEGETVGFVEPGFIKRVTYYRIQLGVEIEVIQ